MFRVRLFPILTTGSIVLFFLLIVGCKDQEHPTEHPAEHPKESAQMATITKDELGDAIEAYIQKESASHGGYFVAYDEKAGKELRLTLDKVHRERLSKVGKDLYFACADFKTPEGRIYDLDVFMTGTDKDNLVFSKFSIHKEAGKERYTWYQQSGIWMKRIVGEPVESPPREPLKEHPTEHPEEIGGRYNCRWHEYIVVRVANVTIKLERVEQC